ncbi:MAG: DUF2971 domain-containing protein [Deltaproteobacteria bacterium]
MMNREDLLQSDILFHYTNLRAGLEKILPSMQLRFSRLADTNDPYEYKALSFPYSQWVGGKDDSFENASRIDDELNSRIKLKTKILCFCRNVGNRCGYEKSRMWSQYGDTHKGFCLALSKKGIKKEIARQFKEEKWFFEKVVYKKMIASNNEARYVDEEILTGYDGFSNHIKAYRKQIYFTKDFDYGDEKEFRLTVLEKDKTVEFLSLEDSLKAVIIGDAFPEEDLSIIRGICSKHSLNLFQNHYYSGEEVLIEVR